MTKNEDIADPFEVTDRKIHAVENIVDKNLIILSSSQHYTHLDTCPKYHPVMFIPCVFIPPAENVKRIESTFTIGLTLAVSSRPTVAYPELVSRGVSKSRKFKWLVKIGACKDVNPLI